MGDIGRDDGDPTFHYEPLERFGEGLTSARPWNLTALAGWSVSTGVRRCWDSRRP